MRKRVVIESPYVGDVEANVAYARACVRDSLRRGESPYASHLFFTQPDLLDDSRVEERELGIEAGLAWGESAAVVAVYVDRGISEGMVRGIQRARERGQGLEVRSLEREVPAEEQLRILFGALEGRAVDVTTRAPATKTDGDAPTQEQAPCALLWLDIETTGLNPERDLILEAAWFVTSFEYPYDDVVRLIEGFPVLARRSPLVRSIVVRHDVDVRTLIRSPEVVAMHDKSGLLAELDERRAEPITKMGEISGPYASIERELLDLSLGPYTSIERELLDLSRDWPLDKDRKVLLAGNSVDFDRSFLRKNMPSFATRLSHRVFDASAFYRQCRSVGMPARPKPEVKHRAREDVLASRDLALACAEWILSGRSCGGRVE